MEKSSSIGGRMKRVGLNYGVAGPETPKNRYEAVNKYYSIYSMENTVQSLSEPSPRSAC